MEAPEQLPAELSEINGNAAASERDQEKENEGVSKKDSKRKITNNAVAVRRSNRCRGQVKRSRDNYSIVSTGREKLDSGTFHRYFMHIWNAFPEEKVKSFTYLDPLWFCMYAHKDKKRKASVLSWIKKDIFSKKYVFVPIVMGSHWSLLIFCNLGESVPGMLLLDSLQATGSTELKRYIRSFLIGIYESEERPETRKQLSKIPFLIPKVPQQKNGEECGFYVLYYMHLFIERAPESFNVSEGCPDFMKKDWFAYEEVEAFKKSLNDLPVAVGDPVSDDYSESLNDRPVAVSDSDDSSDCVEVSMTDGKI